MVYWNKTAVSDINTIFIGLLEWKTVNGQTHLTYDAVVAYLEDLRTIFNHIDLLHFHHKATYNLHKMFGEYVYKYRRNARTSWYACYDILRGCIYLNRIFNNYLTLF